MPAPPPFREGVGGVFGRSNAMSPALLLLAAMPSARWIPISWKMSSYG